MVAVWLTGAALTTGMVFSVISTKLMLVVMIPVLTALTGYLLWFFQDPDRDVPEDERLVLSAADGEVTSITRFSAAEFRKICLDSGLNGTTVDQMEEFSNKPVATGCMLIYLAWIFDSFDGAVARWVRGTSAFGAELDTFVDFLSFSVAPALLVFAVTLPGEPLSFRVLFPTLMVASGAMRLSKFRVTDTERGLKGYTGSAAESTGIEPYCRFRSFINFGVQYLL